MKIITTSKNFQIIVDDEDYYYLSQWKWSVSNSGYAQRMKSLPQVDGKRKKIGIYMHRDIVNAKKGDHVDHINCNKLDNRRCNLRICSRSQNMMNTKSHKDSLSNYKGVCWSKKENKWIARICVNYKTERIGCFLSETEAAMAWNKRAKEIFGEFYRGNDIYD